MANLYHKNTVHAAQPAGAATLLEAVVLFHVPAESRRAVRIYLDRLYVNRVMPRSRRRQHSVRFGKGSRESVFNVSLMPR